MGNFAGRGIFIFRPPEGDNFIEKIYRSYKPAAGGGIRGLLRRDGGVIGAAVSLTTSDGLMQTAQSQRVYTLQVLDERGMIYDCGMQPLVAEGERYLSAVYPTPGNQQAVLDAVPEERREAVAELLETGRPFTLETDRPVEAEMVYCFQAADRYAEAQTAAHLIGYLDYEGNGVTGIEAACDEFLSAHGREVEVSATLNALQQVIPGLEPEVRMSEDAGAGVVLTIDKEIQQCVETIGGEMLEKGAIVVLNPYSGQIKAAASFPAYSPSTWKRRWRTRKIHR